MTTFSQLEKVAGRRLFSAMRRRGSRGFHPERKFREQIKHGLEAGFARELELW